MKKIIIIALLLISSFANSQIAYDLKFNNNIGMAWNSGSKILNSYGIFIMKSEGLSFRDLSNIEKLNIDDSGNVDIQGEYRINGVPLSLGGTPIDTSLLVHKITSTDEAISRYEGTSGRLQNSGITISDSNNIYIPDQINDSWKGAIYKGGDRFIHTYHGVNSGDNSLYIGKNAGSLNAYSRNASQPWEGTYCGAVGNDALHSLTFGYYNFAFGGNALGSLTYGSHCTALGYFNATKVTTQIGVTSVGSQCMQHSIGWGTVAMGVSTFRGTGSGTYRADYSVILGGYSGQNINASYQTILGSYSATNLTTSPNNILIGFYSGSDLTTGNGRNIFLGDSTIGTSSTASYELNIGRSIFGKGIYNDTVKIGVQERNPNSTFDINGSISRRDTSIGSSSYTISKKDYYVIVTYFVGSSTITLPTAVNCKGREYVIKNNTGGQEITMNTTSGEFIDGTASGSLKLNGYECLTVFSNGTQWLIKSYY